MHVLNADGSVAEMCGNGLRCVVRHHLRHRNGGEVLVDTDGGPRRGHLEADGRIRVTMGDARLLFDRVAVGDVEGTNTATAVSLGNPHLVLDPFPPGTPLRSLAERFGPALEHHEKFPERVNVGFAAIESDRVRLVVFERGSGITQACGTGAAAAAAVLRRRGQVAGPEVRVELPGGTLSMVVDANAGADGEALGAVTAVGAATFVYDGQIDLRSDEIHPAE